jgi:NADPH:quinone reductase-like Zn-dependent oxidoreductase
MLTVHGYGGMQLDAEERRAGLEQALEALRAGALRVQIDAILPLDQVNEAFRRLEERQVKGKLLLRAESRS